MSVQRKQGEVVRREVNSCFLGAAEPGLVRLDGPRDTDETCMMGCDNPDCVEWPNVQVVAGEHAGDWLCHLAECQMEDLSHNDAQQVIEAHAATVAALEERLERLEQAGRDCLAALERMYDRNKESAGLRDLRVLNAMRAALAPTEEGGRDA